MRIVVNGVSIFFDVRGQAVAPSGPVAVERPTIILLHGGPGMDHMAFKPAFDRLSESAQLIYMDQRACGRSEAGPTSSWNLDQWTEDLAGFIDSLGIAKPVVLGTSFGGVVAQRLAARYPQLAGGLVLMSTLAQWSPNRTFDAMERRGGRRAREAAEAFFSDAARPGVSAHYLATCFPLYSVGRLDPDAFARVINRPEVLMHFFGRGGEFASLDIRRELSEVCVPTLLVHGEEDPVIPIECATDTLQWIGSPQKRLVRLPSCGHFCEQEAPDAVMDSILEFFGFRADGQSRDQVAPVQEL